jgi:5-formyltetrahydrofolate cyclo-ligase
MKNKNRHTLRQEVLARRDNLTRDKRIARSNSIAQKVMALPEVMNACTVLVYMHFRSDVETFELINRMFTAKKSVTIPYTRTDIFQLIAVHVTDLVQQVIPGYCGIPEPRPELVDKASCDPKNIDVVIIPGSVFDRRGGRLGYGGGYYDRFLTNEAPAAVRIGLAFEDQVVEKVPIEPHDQPMDFVVTEENIYDCGRNRYA